MTDVLPTQGQLVLPLVDAIDEAGGAADTATILSTVADRLAVGREARAARVEIGGQSHNALGHRLRWAQQKAKLAGLVERSEGAWRLTDAGRGRLTRSLPGRPVTIFATDAGCALWGMAEDMAAILDEGSVGLMLTSPPYALNTRKAYGNRRGQAHVDWLCGVVERLVPLLAPDGSLVLNLGDVWNAGSPTVSLWQERLVVALVDRLGLHLCQRLIWQNTAALPVPSNYVGVERIRLKNAAEHLWWLSPSERPFADNRAILEPYSERMERLIARGGSARAKRPSGHAQREGSFSVDNGGSIAPNVMRIANSGDGRYAAACRAAGLPPHPARGRPRRRSVRRLVDDRPRGRGPRTRMGDDRDGAGVRGGRQDAVRGVGAIPVEDGWRGGKPSATLRAESAGEPPATRTERMLVSLFSDASLCTSTGVSAWAAWIKCDRGAARGDGALKRLTVDSALAEAMAVVNGLAIACRRGLVRPGDVVLVQTDCDAVMDVLEGRARRRATKRQKARGDATWKELRTRARVRNQAIAEVSAHYLAEVERLGIRVIWRHCKGHKGLETKRSAVNTSCDQRAKARMQDARREHMRNMPTAPVPAGPPTVPNSVEAPVALAA